VLLPDLRVAICVGDGVFENWVCKFGVDKLGWASWGVQVRVCRSGYCKFLGFHSLME
jgi:hypothetical protein